MVITTAMLFITCRSEMKILRKSLRCDENTRAVAVGDSRIAEHLDTEELPWIKNCGIPGTTFAITVRKAKLVVEENPNLEMLIIGIDPGTFFTDFNSPFPNYIPIYVSLFELTNREFMPPIEDGIAHRIVRGLLIPGIYNLLCAPEKQHSYLVGGFSKLHKTINPEKLKDINSYITSQSAPSLVSPTGGEIMLTSLLKWLKHHDNINIVLITTPLYHLSWEYGYNDEYRNYFIKKMKEISQTYDVTWYNWMLDYQDNPEYWADSGHLNAIGARQFSKELGIILQRHLKSEQN